MVMFWLFWCASSDVRATLCTILFWLPSVPSSVCRLVSPAVPNCLPVAVEARGLPTQLLDQSVNGVKAQSEGEMSESKSREMCCGPR